MINNSITRSSEQPVFRQDGKVVGYIYRKTLRKNVKGSYQMLKKPRGCAWDYSILVEARNQGVERVVIYDKESDITYIASLNEFFDCGVTLEKIKEEIGWDVKVADDLSNTKPPTDEELSIYREKIVAERRLIFRRPDKEEK